MPPALSHPDRPSAAPTSHTGAREGRNNWHTLITGMKMEVLLAGHATSGTQVPQHAATGEASHGKPRLDSTAHPKGQQEASSRNVPKSQKTFCQDCSWRFLRSSASSLPFPRDGGWEEKGILGGVH